MVQADLQTGERELWPGLMDHSHRLIIRPPSTARAKASIAPLSVAVKQLQNAKIRQKHCISHARGRVFKLFPNAPLLRAETLQGLDTIALLPSI